MPMIKGIKIKHKCHYCKSDEIYVDKLHNITKQSPYKYKATCSNCGVSINGISKKDAIKRFEEECCYE